MTDFPYKSSGPGRLTKKSTNACSRCRRQKIKCSGDHPCTACNKRKAACKYDDRDQKVVVTKGYLQALQKKAQESAARPLTAESETHALSSAEDVSDDIDTASKSNTSPFTNQLSSGPSTFMTSESGRFFYLGTSSNWSFTRRILCLAHEAVHQVSIPTTALHFDGETYSIRRAACDASSGALAIPSRDYALHLINNVQFHCGQLFHLYDQPSFMEGFDAFYAAEGGPSDEMWYVHFLLIMAFGKAFATKKVNDGYAPGGSFFEKAMSLLPDISNLARDPALGTEILCCVALYLHCVDHRMPAYNYIGQALRLALSHGMHTDMATSVLGDTMVQRCRRIWWTAFVLECEMASLMGMPRSWRSEDAFCPLPDFPDDPRRTAALITRIELARQIATITSSVYGEDGRLDTLFVPRTKEALSALAHLSGKLQDTFPLPKDDGCGISRLAAHLHLLYYQCIVLATRPVLFCVFKMRLQSMDGNSENTAESVPTSLIQGCVEASQKIIMILSNLQSEGLLETFLVFDLESLAISTATLILALFLEPSLAAKQGVWVSKAWAIFDDLCMTGNLLAQLKRSELQHLGRLLEELLSQTSGESILLSRQLPPLEPETYPWTGAKVVNSGIAGPPFADSIGDIPIYHTDSLDGDFEVDFSAQQLLDMADSIDMDCVNWMV